MTKIARRNLWLAVFLVLGLTVLDQWVKMLAVHYLRFQPGHVFLGGAVQIEYAENRGAFLSLGDSLSEESRFWIFVFGVFLILGFCVYSLWKTLPQTLSTWAFSLVIAGGIGNLIDRVRQGYVVDYIHMGIGPLRTGVFNVADVAISAGLLLLVYLQYWPEKKKQQLA